MPGATLKRRPDFDSFLRAHKDEILAVWAKAARRNPRAAELEETQLMNFIPLLFDRLVGLVGEFLAGRPAQLAPEIAEHHAVDRLKEGFDLAEVVNELSLIRECILLLWRQHLEEEEDGHRAEYQVLTRAVDQTIAASINRYTEARDRMLRALDRVSSTALAARDLDELLDQLAQAFQEEMASVDIVAILLRDGDVLRIRAARGHEADASIGFAIGEGFAGTIAAERKPRLLHDAATDPLLSNELIRSKGTRSLYGVPLIDGGELVGVAYMGSSIAEEFSGQDLVLFESMTSRASAGVYQQILRDRAERRARALEESEQKFETTFENAALGIAHLGLDGSWLLMNKKYCEILGYSHDELRRLTFQAVTHPDDLPKDLDMRHRLATGQVESYVLEMRYLRKDGQIAWVDLAVGVVRDAEARPRYFVATAMDITKKKETEALLREREERLRLIVDTTGIGAFDFYPQTARLEWSIHAKRHFGLPPEARVGYDVILRGLHPDDRERVVAIGKNTLERENGGAFAAEFRTIGIEDGKERWLSARGMATFDAAGKPERFFGFTLDVTDQKRAEHRLRESDRRKDEFIAMLGHELRNPLASICSATELIKLTSMEDARLQRAHAVLERQSAHMSRLIDGLLEISRISRGKIHLDRETLDVRKIIEGVLSDRMPQLAAQKLQLTSDLPPAPVWVWGDHVRLAQVIDNLIGNAIKFTDPGGRISVTLHKEDGAARIWIRDTGIGIRREMLARLFEPFQQESQGIARAAGGLGLGLAVAKGLVELHGGSIQAHSSGPSAGAEFEVRLPETSAPAELHQPKLPSPALRRRVLIVEDNTDAAQMLRELLELSGHTVTVVGSGLAALDALRDHGADVVLCDLGLPGMSGYDLARAIRNEPELADIPLIALTGYGQPDDRRRTAEAGFDDHLTKPVDLTALGRLLERL